MEKTLTDCLKNNNFFLFLKYKHVKINSQIYLKFTKIELCCSWISMVIPPEEMLFAMAQVSLMSMNSVM